MDREDHTEFSVPHWDGAPCGRKDATPPASRELKLFPIVHNSQFFLRTSVTSASE